jgi:hypothetical protein
MMKLLMMSDDRKGECEGNQDKCNLPACPKFGTLGRPSRDGFRRVKGCSDPAARGKRARTKGLSKQRTARKRLGVAPSNKFGDANEENWQDVLFANEVKAGKQIGAVVTAWGRIDAQVRSNESDYGSRRKPTRAILMPDDWGKEGLVMIKLSVWEELVRPAMTEYYDGIS